MNLQPRTLAAKFVLIVALGAVLPLVLVGLWLTRSAERSGTQLLRGQLDHAVAAIAQEMNARWSLRSGELQLLASNSSAGKIASGAPITAQDSTYLLQLAQSLSNAIPSFSFVDSQGTERWSYGPTRDRGTSSRTFLVVLPMTADGRDAGTLKARVSLASILAPQVGQALVPGAKLVVLDARGEALVGTMDSTFASPESVQRAGWEVASTRATGAPLQVIVAAPVSPYVAPFEHAASIGVGVLLIVALLALSLGVALSVQITRSLERLADAASAVAQGDLHRTVDEPSNDEIGRLATAFNAMTNSLRHTVSELAGQRALAAVGEFAVSLSHEVRNSLTAVRIDLQHARRTLSPDEPETKLVVRALESVRRLDATVTGALRVARGGRVTKTRADLNGLLERAMRNAEPSFVERGAVLETMDDVPVVEVEGDVAALEQLFLNLFINAAQASRPDAHTRVEIQPTESHVIVRIIDAGEGISMSALPDLGTPFRTTKTHGTGLGLPIARQIALAHGGDLTFESVQGAGTTASVRLPIV